jgi:hypothetical protein
MQRVRLPAARVQATLDTLNPFGRNADRCSVNTHKRALQQLIGDGMYVIDERAVAAAILTRANVRLTVPSVSFQNGSRALQVRSFRRDPGARSFRLQRSHAPARQHH